jgi:hypothetical protein
MNWGMHKVVRTKLHFLENIKSGSIVGKLFHQTITFAFHRIGKFSPLWIHYFTKHKCNTHRSIIPVLPNTKSGLL